MISQTVLYTYIIPSKLRLPGFEEHISGVCKCESVDRVIIVNSRGDDYCPTILGKGLYEHRDKVLIVNSSKRTEFKNSAWNVGVCYAKNISNYFIFATENLRFDSYVIDLVTEQIEDLPNLGVLGIADEIITTELIKDETNYIYTEEVEKCNDKFGTLMFVPRKKYKPIDGVKFLYGDEFILKSMKERGFNNFVIRSDTFRIKDISPENTIEERLQIALDKEFWKKTYESIFTI